MTGSRMIVASALMALLAAVASGCGSSSDRETNTSLAAIDTPAPSTPPPPQSSSSKPCADPTASLRPEGALPIPGHMPAGTMMRRIQERGRLIAGVDQNTLGFAYLNPLTGQLQGFEIDLLRQLARVILGDPSKVEFEAITTKQRLPYVQEGKVDVVADAVTITCDRLHDVAFSTVYYDAGQRVLVPSSSNVRRIEDLGGRYVRTSSGSWVYRQPRRVCATSTSTSLANIAKARPRPLPGAPSDRVAAPIPYPVAQRTDCLVALQEGKVDAISTDDAILLGFAVQDPYTRNVGPRFTDEPYGIAINKAHPEFVRFVNGVLERMRRDGTWKSIYTRWLAGISTATSPPTPRYRD